MVSVIDLLCSRHDVIIYDGESHACIIDGVRLHPGQDWKGGGRLESETRAVEAELGDGGRVLIRASGTEPLLRIMVEARDEQQSMRCAQRLVQAVQAG
jgi:phosphoglucosamine mutase